MTVQLTYPFKSKRHSCPFHFIEQGEELHLILVTKNSGNVKIVFDKDEFNSAIAEALGH